MATPGSSTLSIAWTCCFSAPPVPTTAFLTSRAACSATGSEDRPQAASTAPRACASLSVDCGFLLRNTSSTAARSGEWAAITAAIASCRLWRRSLIGALGSVATSPCATRLSRAPSLRTIPQPVQDREGSRPRISMRALPLLGRDRGGGRWSPGPAPRPPPLKGRGSWSPELLHHLVGDLVIAPHGLHVVVVLERVDQLEQRLRVAFGDFDGEVGLPRELDALGLAEARLERPGDFVQRFHVGPDRVAVGIALDALCAVL